MKMYLQVGWGMMGLCRDLLKLWKGAGAILSPRDLTHVQITRLGKSVSSLGGEALIDPQCYIHASDHDRLTNHEYWQEYASNSTFNMNGSLGWGGVLGKLAELASESSVKRHILPGLLAKPVSDDWFDIQSAIIEEAPAHFGGEPLIATIALSIDAVRDENQLEAVIERAEKWDVDGFYVVVESPSSYLVEDPVWLGNVLSLCSGLRLTGKSVLVGYCNHQMLCLASANVDVIASGTWKNVRSFGTERFNQRAPDDIARRTLWYYSPIGLSEFKIPFMDVAKTRGVLASMQAPTSLGSMFSKSLFSGAQPSSVDWREPDAFRHYLTCLRNQVLAARKPSFKSTVDFHRTVLDDAENLLLQLRSCGVFAGDRGFWKCLDTNRSALISLENTRGGRLKRNW